MGASTSRQTETSTEKTTNPRERPQSPKEKHNSAESQAPLAGHAAFFASSHRSLVGRRRSVATSTSRSRRASTIDSQNKIHPAPHEPSFEVATQIDTLEGHSNVTRPPPPPRLHQLSELIDPAELPIDSHIRSPSGTLLALEQFLVHPDRPRSMRERQEAIQESVRTASRLGVGARRSEDGVPEKGAGMRSSESNAKKKSKKSKGGCWSCFAPS